jgi:hypothetical protein
MRALLLVAVLSSACFEEHAATQVAVVVRDCELCHMEDYNLAPDHVGARPTTCVDCHRLRDWKGLLGGTHYEPGFVIRNGPHASIFCADCHDPDISPDNTKGLNVTCIGCHTGAHDKARMDDKHHEEDGYLWDPAMPAHCRTCHPLGLHDDD